MLIRPRGTDEPIEHLDLAGVPELDYGKQAPEPEAVRCLLTLCWGRSDDRFGKWCDPGSHLELLAVHVQLTASAGRTFTLSTDWVCLLGAILPAN